MTYNVLILFTKLNSPVLLGLELYDSLSRYKELKIYFRHSYFISKEDIKSHISSTPLGSNAAKGSSSNNNSGFFNNATAIEARFLIPAE